MTLQLGKRVKYLRMQYDDAGNSFPIEGEGNIMGIFLSADRREQVRVLDGKNIYNIDMPAIDATEAGKKRYFDHIYAVNALAKKHNDEIMTMTKTGNSEIEAVNLAYLGEKVLIEGAQANDNEE